MRKAAVADHLRRFEFAPGLGNVERVRVEHHRRQLGIEVRASQRRQARQLERGARQLRQAAFDQRTDAARLRQLAAGLQRHRIARQHEIAQRLEREQRVAAAVAQQRGRETRWVKLGQAERFDQLGELRQAERRQRHGFDALRFLERGTQLRGPLAGIGGTLRQTPAQSRQGVGLDQGLQQIEARIVGEVQVVDDNGTQAEGCRVAQRGIDRSLQQQSLRRARPRHRGTEFGQQQRQFLRAHGRRRDRERLQHRAQQPRHHGAGHARIAWPRLDDDSALLGGAEVGNEPALADAGLANQQESAARGPRGAECAQLTLAADQARRTQQACRRHRAT